MMIGVRRSRRNLHLLRKIKSGSIKKHEHQMYEFMDGTLFRQSMLNALGPLLRDHLSKEGSLRVD